MNCKHNAIRPHLILEGSWFTCFIYHVIAVLSMKVCIVSHTRTQRRVFTCNLFYDVLIIWTVAPNGRMIEGLCIGRDLWGSGPCLIEVLSWYLPGGTEKSYENLSQGTGWPGRDSKLVSPLYKSRALQLELIGEICCSVACLSSIWVSHSGCCEEPCLLHAGFVLGLFFTVKMAARCSSETSVDFQWTGLC
jgi:hypothetical protein